MGWQVSLGSLLEYAKPILVTLLQEFFGMQRRKRKVIDGRMEIVNVHIYGYNKRLFL
jgi:hypothetical protein